jgi:hypothetical protein
MLIKVDKEDCESIGCHMLGKLIWGKHPIQCECQTRLQDPDRNSHPGCITTSCCWLCEAAEKYGCRVSNYENINSLKIFMFRQKYKILSEKCIEQNKK